MALAKDVLTMLRPEGGWIVTGNEYEGIEFISCEPITKQEFLNGFVTAEIWLADQEKKQVANKAALLAKLGITAEEAALLLA